MLPFLSLREPLHSSEHADALSHDGEGAHSKNDVAKVAAEGTRQKKSQMKHSDMALERAKRQRGLAIT